MISQKIFFTGLFALICLGLYICIICRNFKIVEETKNRLIFQIRPTFSWTSSIFFGGFALISILFTLTIPPITIINCTHYSPPISTHQPSFNTNCELTAINWLGREQSKIIIPELREALLEAKLYDGINSAFDRYRGVLVTAQENIPLIDGYISPAQPAYQHLLTIVSQINSFLENPLKESLTIYDETEKRLGYTGFAISAFVGLVTFLILAFAPYITCSFDRELNLVTIERSSLFGKKIFEHKTSDITAVTVEDASEEANYRLVLMLSSGEKLPLTYFFSSGWHEKQHMANRVQKFLRIGKQ